MPGPGDGTYAEWVKSAVVPVPDLMAGLDPSPGPSPTPEPDLPPEPDLTSEPNLTPEPALTLAPDLPSEPSDVPPVMQPPQPPMQPGMKVPVYRHHESPEDRTTDPIHPRAIGPPRR